MRYNMRLISLKNEYEAQKAIQQIGSEGSGIALMAGKPIGRAVKLEGVPLKVAHILKQEALSLGADAAVHRGVIVNAVDETDVLLVGTVKQLKLLAKKIMAQPFGLKQVSKDLVELLKFYEPSAERVLECGGKQLTLGKRTLIMGILNITPDSFSDGGKFYGLEQALKQAEKLLEEGADILDIGGESTRPGHAEVNAAEEWSRLEPVLRELTRQVDIPISVDTWKAEVARRAIEAGANLINDVWGLQKDPEMAKVVGDAEVPIIIMHNQQGTAYHHLMGDILAFLRESTEKAEANGLQGDQIIIDPGIGFGKTTEQNLEVMSRLAELKSLGHPILLGTSRKSMIGNALSLPVDERLEGTLATSVIGVQAGVDIIRVHDVLANRRAVEMADAIIRKQRGENYGGA